MVEPLGWKDSTFRHAKVLGNVCVSGFKDNVWVSDWVIFVFVDLRIK